ncbi:S8 family serine peptidase [Bacillus sp. FJAT-49705]|uniref:S8 family serine peptidase n=1 Tax=Cytobacillus citreus TaxID=2833586 RepID=A0ABS5NYY4_9BACI|nr:S8 family serine peptidase [Cytobacillus citreus]MBS4193062.1 S8 family serine peptidase [Cytobacillus citreus]
MKQKRFLKLFSSLLVFTLIISLLNPIFASAEEKNAKKSVNVDESILEMRGVIADQEALRKQEPTLHPLLENISDSEEISVIVQLSEPSVALEIGKNKTQGKNSISESKKDQIRNKVKAQHRKFEQQLGEFKINYKKGFEYSEAFNGMSLKLRGDKVKALLNLKGVLTIEPDLEVHALGDADQDDQVGIMMTDSAPHLQVPELWNMGIEGQNVKVAVLDTGIDYHHPEFEGVYKGGYNFVKHNPNDYVGTRADNDPYETSPSERPSNKPEFNQDGRAFYTSHGTHVAGTIAAQGKNAYGIKGLAPKVELYAYRVLGAYGSGSTSGIIAAIDKSVVEDMDIINLSLGGSQNSQTASDAIAINNATLAGVTAVIATGNSGPNRGTIGNPATSALAISVGNSTLPEKTMQAKVSTEAGAYKADSNINLMGWTYGEDPQSTLSGTYDVVAIPGVGRESDFVGIDVKGKVALISRGEIAFVDKIAAAKKAGAIATIIHNNVDGAGPANVYLSTSFEFIPSFDMATGEGKAFRQALASSPGKVTFSNYTNGSTEGDAINNSSSRGPANPVFDIKPDVVAPGTNIMSSVPAYGKENPDADYSKSYDRSSGTSMATPHVAGIAALLKSKNPDWTPADIKVAISNTAKLLDTGSFDVFAQGPGLVQPLKAVQAEALAYSLDTTVSNNATIDNIKGTVTFGKVPPNPNQATTVTKQIKVKNLTSGSSNYEASVEVTKLPSGPLSEAQVSLDQESFTLSGEQVLNVTLHVPATATVSGAEIQGYIHITNGTTNLILPFAADFSPNILSGIKHYSVDHNAISPNRDGKLDSTTVRYEFHNEHSTTQIALWDASNQDGGYYGDGTVGYILGVNRTTVGPKSVTFDGSYTEWGTFIKKQAPEGVYTLDLAALNPLGGISSDWAGPIYVKTSAPKINITPVNGELEGSTYEVTGSIKDKFIDFKLLVESVFGDDYDVNDHLTVNYELKDKTGNVVDTKPVTLNQDGSFAFSLTGLTAGENTLKLNVNDIAQNAAEQTVTLKVKDGTSTEPPIDPTIIVVTEEDIADQVNDPNTTEVVITLPAITASAEIVQAEMSNAILTTLEQSKKSVVFQTGDVKAKVPTEVMSQLTQSAPDKTRFSINLMKGEAVPVGKDATIVTDMYGFSFVTETKGASTVVNQVNAAVEIQLPVIKTIVNDKKLMVLSMKKDSKQPQMIAAQHVNGAVVFSTSQLATFVGAEMKK